ncbi:xylulose kinase-1 [Tanacetum coccineum]
MEHYLRQYVYAIWEVIQKGNGHVSVSTDTNGVIKVLPPKTAEEILARERERKARTTLLMDLPEDHLAKFHKMTDAKEIWDAIKSRFGGNDESRRCRNTSLKQLFECFFCVSTKDANQKLLSGSTLDMKIGAACRRLQFEAKEPVGFDKTKVECFNCHKTWHFARECLINRKSFKAGRMRCREHWI